MSQVIISRKKKSGNFIDQIVKIVAAQYNMTPETVKASTRKREIVQVRQIAMCLAKDFTNASLAHIGAEIGGKDHATVLHACKTVNDLLDTDRQYRGKFYVTKEAVEGASINFENNQYDLVCLKCGGKNVHTKAWIDANTKKYVDDIEGCDEQDNWCLDCRVNCKLILRKDYELLNYVPPEPELSGMDVRLEEIRKEFETEF